MTVRVVIADDQRCPYRLRMISSPRDDLEVVGEAVDGLQGLCGRSCGPTSY